MDDVLPFVMGAITLCIPIVAILTHHQRKMAEIIHSRHQAAPELLAQIEYLRREVGELRQVVYQHVIATDGQSALQPDFRPGQVGAETPQPRLGTYPQ